MDSEQLEHARRTAEAIAEEAGKVVLEGFRAGVAVQKKGVVDLLTEYDLRSEELIRTQLAAAFPEHAIVGEEGEEVGSGDLVWFVDPIDGTTNFVHGHPFFSVSIGLCHGSEPLVGVVSAPALCLTWAGARGLGTFRNGELCAVSQCVDVGEALCATGFPYDRRTSEENNLRELGAFIKRCQGVRRGGSAALDLAMVADGTFDAYWEQKLNAWDMCAGALLVLEAGGQLSNYEGGAADPRTGQLVATNGSLHEQVLAILTAARGRPTSCG